MEVEGLQAEVTPAERRRPAGGARFLKLARWAVTLGLMGVLLSLVDLRALGRTLASVDLLLLSAAVAVALLDRGLMAVKWYPLVRVQDPSVSIGRAVRVYLVAGFASLLIPTPVTGDVLRAVALGRGRSTVAEVGASIAAERLLGMMSSAFLCLVAVAVAVRTPVRLEYLLPWVAGFLALTAVLLLLPLSTRVSSRLGRWAGPVGQAAWMRFVRRFGTAYTVYRHELPTLALVAVLSVLEQTIPILNVWILARAFGAPVGIETLIVAVPLSLFLARLPVSVAGIGVAEGALVYFLGLFGVAPFQALALGLGGTFLNLAVVIPGAFLWSDLLRSGKREPPGDPEVEPCVSE